MAYDPSNDLWGLMYDLDQSISVREGQNPHPPITPMLELLHLQRRQVRILLRLHDPDTCPDEWIDD